MLTATLKTVIYGYQLQRASKNNSEEAIPFSVIFILNGWHCYASTYYNIWNKKTPTFW